MLINSILKCNKIERLKYKYYERESPHFLTVIVGHILRPGAIQRYVEVREERYLWREAEEDRDAGIFGC